MRVGFSRSRALEPQRRHEGFVLIELMVVIAIIAILISLITPAVQSARASARRISCETHLDRLAAALPSPGRQLPSQVELFRATGIPDDGVLDGATYHVHRANALLAEGSVRVSCEPLAGRTGLETVEMTAIPSGHAWAVDTKYIPIPGADEEQQQMYDNLARIALRHTGIVIGMAGDHYGDLVSQLIGFVNDPTRVDETFDTLLGPEPTPSVDTLEQRVIGFSVQTSDNPLLYFWDEVAAEMKLGALGEDLSAVEIDVSNHRAGFEIHGFINTDSDYYVEWKIAAGHSLQLLAWLSDYLSAVLPYDDTGESPSTEAPQGSYDFPLEVSGIDTTVDGPASSVVEQQARATWLEALLRAE